MNEIYDFISQYVSYDPETGVFKRIAIFNDKPNHHWRIGQEVGNATSNGYIEIAVGDFKVSAHKLAFYLAHKELPDVVDHLNGDKKDNRISNLRSVNASVNQRNRKMNSNNTTGQNAISCLKSGKYRVRLRIDGILKSLGSYLTLEEAVKVRDAAYIEYGFTERHGK